MKCTRSMAFVLLLAGLSVAPDVSAQPAPLTMAVLHAGQDPLGGSFAGHVKELLRQSSKYRVADTEEDADLTVRLSTIDPTPQKRGTQASASWSITLTKRGDGFLSGGVLAFGADRAEEAARSLVVNLDSLVSRHREEIPGSAESREAERSWEAAVGSAAEKIRLERRRKLFLQHMELQRKVFQLSGYLLPNAADMAGSLAAEYDESDLPLFKDDLEACRTELAALKKGTKPPVKK